MKFRRDARIDAGQITDKRPERAREVANTIKRTEATFEQYGYKLIGATWVKTRRRKP